MRSTTVSLAGFRGSLEPSSILRLAPPTSFSSIPRQTPTTSTLWSVRTNPQLFGSAWEKLRFHYREGPWMSSPLVADRGHLRNYRHRHSSSQDRFGASREGRECHRSRKHLRVVTILNQRPPTSHPSALGIRGRHRAVDGYRAGLSYSGAEKVKFHVTNRIFHRGCFSPNAKSIAHATGNIACMFSPRPWVLDQPVKFW